MFTCAVCDKPIGPGAKPIKVVTGYRPVVYQNNVTAIDDYGNSKTRSVESNGLEIIGEALVCTADAGQEAEKKISVIKLGGRCFEEKQVPQFTQQLIHIAAENGLNRVHHKTKRADADSRAAIPLFKEFLDRNEGKV